MYKYATHVVAAAHCKIEIASALNRQRHDGTLSGEAYASIIAAMERSRLRATDALHIGTAQLESVQLFVTADRKLALPAQAVGLNTELVGG